MTTLHDTSALAFMLEPWLDLFNYEFEEMTYFFGFDNGLFYQTPYSYPEQVVYAVSEDDEVSDSCYAPLSKIEITNPEPFGGYDVRCRPWFQSAVIG